jgi:hypothetical protein
MSPGTIREISNAGSQAGGIRAYLRLHYLEPARQRGERFVTLTAGEIHKELGLSNRVPSVCQVMESKILEREAGVKVSSKQGPPSGRGTTFTVTYAVEPASEQAVPRGERQSAATQSAEGTQEDGLRLFYEMRGVLKDAFAEVGGGEAWLRKEREGFYGPFSRKKLL